MWYGAGMTNLDRLKIVATIAGFFALALALGDGHACYVDRFVDNDC